ncbi:hypothetical protein KIL84_018517 [Mauremys mutica]|uniref:Uncharacterized protein n=1 Tax=Mauremys mutica TaxID=74926 RepID=A0A9D3XUT9_9SAUR|nr:hypothetical protein KIL84_018517 [Mauremys mutica]
MEEGKHDSLKYLADKGNRRDVTRLDDAFLEDTEALESIASNNEDEPGPPCFCSMPIQIVEEDTEDESYEEYRRRLGMKLTEPVPCRYVMQCLCFTQEHFAQGVTLINTVQINGDPDHIVKKMTTPEDACLQRYIDHLIFTKC